MPEAERISKRSKYMSWRLKGWVALDDTLECKSWRILTAFAVFTGVNFLLHTTLDEFASDFSRSPVDQLINE